MVRLALMLAPLLALVIGATPVKPPGSRAVAAAKPRGSQATAAQQVLPWIEDDFTRAVAEARVRKLPIFVESWAPW